MTNQEAFDTVVRHLAAQNWEQSSEVIITKREEGEIERETRCLYRGPDGKKCAIGALIPDEEYRPEFEGKGAYELLENMPFDLTCLKGLNGDLLDRLQSIHDDFLGNASFSLRVVFARIKQIAKDHGLDYSVVDEVLPDA